MPASKLYGWPKHINAALKAYNLYSVEHTPSY